MECHISFPTKQVVSQRSVAESQGFKRCRLSRMQPKHHCVINDTPSALHHRHLTAIQTTLCRAIVLKSPPWPQGRHCRRRQRSLREGGQARQNQWHAVAPVTFRGQRRYFLRRWCCTALQLHIAPRHRRCPRGFRQIIPYVDGFADAVVNFNCIAQHRVLQRHVSPILGCSFSCARRESHIEAVPFCSGHNTVALSRSVMDLRCYLWTPPRQKGNTQSNNKTRDWRYSIKCRISSRLV